MKVILVRHYDGPWKESGRDYKLETKKFLSDDAYLLLRNAVASVNSYEIVDIEVQDNEQITSCSGVIRDFEDWAGVIFRLKDFFHSKFLKNPQILVASEKTFRKIDAVAGSKVKGLKGVDFKLEFCQDDSLEEGAFRLVHDEQAFFE